MKQQKKRGEINGLICCFYFFHFTETSIIHVAEIIRVKTLYEGGRRPSFTFMEILKKGIEFVVTI